MSNDFKKKSTRLFANKNEILEFVKNLDPQDPKSIKILQSIDKIKWLSEKKDSKVGANATYATVIYNNKLTKEVVDLSILLEDALNKNFEYSASLLKTMEINRSSVALNNLNSITEEIRIIVEALSGAIINRLRVSTFKKNRFFRKLLDSMDIEFLNSYVKERTLKENSNNEKDERKTTQKVS